MRVRTRDSSRLDDDPTMALAPGFTKHPPDANHGLVDVGKDMGEMAFTREMRSRRWGFLQEVHWTKQTRGTKGRKEGRKK